MKHIILTLLVTCATSIATDAHQKDALSGAWKLQQGDIIQTAVFVDGYVSHSTFDLKNKKFISTRGGTYKTDGKTLTVTWQYDTDKAASNAPADTWVGQSSTFDVTPGSTLST